MVRVPLGQGAFNRTFGREAEIELRNRFFEQNPTNQTDAVALLSRPGTTFEEDFGVGPGRATFTLKNLHDGDLFVVSNDALYRYDADGNTQAISGTVATSGSPRMAGVRGAGYQRLFIADGTTLQFYGGESYSATLTLTPGTIANDVVIVDGVYYQFTSGSVAAAATGIISDPYLVAIGGSNANALANLRKAINASGTAGTDYSTGLEPNARVESNANTSTTVVVRNRGGGAPVTAIPVSVTVVSGADGLAWSSGNLAASGNHVLSGVATPDDIGIVSITVLKSFVLCVQANSQRVYFIRPGEITIDGDDFFEAESEPDELIEAITVGDQVWFVGRGSTEPWFLEGTDEDAPFKPLDGRPFSRGAIEGTVVKLADSVFLVGDDKIVYRIRGGPEPISNPGIAERVRKALDAERENA